jgi:hypothetical protein
MMATGTFYLIRTCIKESKHDIPWGWHHWLSSILSTGSTNIINIKTILIPFLMLLFYIHIVWNVMVLGTYVYDIVSSEINSRHMLYMVIQGVIRNFPLVPCQTVMAQTWAKTCSKKVFQNTNTVETRSIVFPGSGENKWIWGNN